MRNAFFLAVLVAAGTATAQQGPTALDSIPINVNVADFGVLGDGSDDCLLLDLGTASTAGAQNFDLRLTACQGQAAGTLIDDQAVIEKSASYPQANGATAETALYADRNNNGRYDTGDVVYLTSGPGFPTSQSSGTWSVRLTPVPTAAGGFAAGTLVFSGDADHAAYATTATTLSASLTWVDNDGTGAVFSSPDPAYFVAMAPGGLQAGSLVPSGSILVHAAPPNDAYPGDSSSTSTTSTTPASQSPQSSGSGTDDDDPGTSASESPTGTGKSQQTPLLPPGLLLLALVWLACQRSG